MSRALIVVTNHARFDDTTRATGLWLAEATHFHDVMSQNGIAVDYVSPTGGFVPLDPGSLAASEMTRSTGRITATTATGKSTSPTRWRRKTSTRPPTT